MLNKLDILSGIETIRLCVAYELDGRRVETWPSSGAALSRATPIYDEFDGLGRADQRHPLAGRPAGERPALRVGDRGRTPASRSCSCRSARSGPRRSSGPGGRCATARGCRREPRDADPHRDRGERRARARAGLEAGRRAGRQRGHRGAGERCDRARAAGPLRAGRGSAGPGGGRRGRPARGRRTGRHRARGAAGRRRRRCADRGRVRGLRADRGGGPDRVEQGVLPRGRGGGRRAAWLGPGRSATRTRPIAFAGGAGAGGPRRRGQGGRADGRQGRDGVRHRSRRRNGRSASSAAGAAAGPRRATATGSSSRSGSIGREASLIAICDGRTRVPLPMARDHKRLLDGDRGPNTGGMGAYSPLPELSDEAGRDLLRLPSTARSWPSWPAAAPRSVARSTPGLMLTDDGPVLLECNARFGDPETQADPAAACRRPRPDPAGRGARRPRAGARGVRASRRASPARSPARRSRSSWPPPAIPKRRASGDPIEGLDEAAANGRARLPLGDGA